MWPLNESIHASDGKGPILITEVERASERRGAWPYASARTPYYVRWSQPPIIKLNMEGQGARPNVKRVSQVEGKLDFRILWLLITGALYVAGD